MSAVTIAIGRIPRTDSAATYRGDNDWRRQALCAQVDPDLWFPEKGGGTKDAKTICRRCPVLAPCRAWVIEADERFGVAGGLSERDRRKLRLVAS